MFISRDNAERGAGRKPVASLAVVARRFGVDEGGERGRRGGPSGVCEKGEAGDADYRAQHV